MSNIVTIKNNILIGITCVGGFLSYAFSMLDKPKKFLLLLMVCDYLSGVVLAFYFKNSNKTQSGAYSSSAGFKGICKKAMILLIVCVAICFDYLLNITYVANGVCMAFIVNEVTSILENGKLMNIKYPKILDNCLDVVRSQTE